MFRKPFNGYWCISQEFGNKDVPDNAPYKVHNGVDIACPKMTPIMHVNDGQVIFAGVDPSASKYQGGYGNLIRTKHADGFESYFGHLESIVSKTGQMVKKGDLAGYSGATGFCTGPHLHYGLLENSVWVDPTLYYEPEVSFKTEEKFAIGTKLIVQEDMYPNFRSAAGLDGIKIGELAPGTVIEITGAPNEKDSLTWYPFKIVSLEGLWIARADQTGANLVDPPIS